MAELEERYLVLKFEDIKVLNFYQREQLQKLCARIAQIRAAQGKTPDTSYIVVSKNWPMYQETVDKVLAYAEQQELHGS